MDNAFRSLGSLFTVLLIGLGLGIIGCENPGSIGSNLTDSRTDFVVDTFSVEGITATEFNSYSGDFEYFSAGQYQDPLFGNMKATALYKPALPISSVEISEDAKMVMRIFLNKDQIYGDTSATQNFDIYEVAERWRGTSALVKNSIQIDENAQVGSFSVDDQQDSLDIDITSWIQKDSNYKQYAEMDSTSLADSLYIREVFGMGIVPTNSNKIVPIIADSMEFHIQNPETDTLVVGPEDWAYSLEREGNGAFPDDSVPVYSTLESVINFDHDFSEFDIRQTGISKAELVFYQNNTVLEQSLQSEPNSAVRPVPTTARLHLVDPEYVPVTLDPGDPITTATYSEEDGAYHFGLTVQIQNILSNGIPENLEFYVTFSNNGIIRPSLIYTDRAPGDKSPKLIISSIKSSDD